MNEEIAVSNLREAKEIFDKHHVRFLLSQGTLLGAVRDGRIIEWDHDIDLITTDDNWEQILSTVPEFLKRGFRLQLENFKVYDDVFKKSISIVRAGCPTYLFLFQAKGENVVSARIEPTNPISCYLYSLYVVLATPSLPPTASRKFRVAHKLCSLLPSQLRKFLTMVMRLMCTVSGCKLYLWVTPRRYFEQPGNIEFYGMTFKIPSDVENYLKYHYGEDWKTPKRKWIAYEEDGGVRALKRPYQLTQRGYFKFK